MNEIPNDMATKHMAEFLQAVRNRQQPSCTTQEGHYSTATVKLAMIAYDVGARIVWDSKSERIIDNAEASRLLKREYRLPWKHPKQT